MKKEIEFRKIISVNHNFSLCVTIPKSYVKNLGITKGDTVKLKQLDDYIVIKKAEDVVSDLEGVSNE